MAMKHFSGNLAISCNTCNHPIFENFRILSNGNYDFDINVIEALYIKKQGPLLNIHITHLVHHFFSKYLNYN